MGPTIIVSLIIAAAVCAAIFRIIKNKKDGKCSCGCEGCAYKSNCHR